MIRRALFAVVCAAVAAGCNGGGASPPPFFTGTRFPQQLYVGNYDGSGSIYRYDLPIQSGGQTPNLRFAPPQVRQSSPPSTTPPSIHATPEPVFYEQGRIGGLGMDAAGDLAVGLQDGRLYSYRPPISGENRPNSPITPISPFAIPSGGDGYRTEITQIAFTPAGDVFVGIGSTVYLSRFLGFYQLAVQITNPALLTIGGVALDAAQNLYVDDFGGNLFVYAPPYSGVPAVTVRAPGTAYHGSAIDAKHLFVTASGSGLGRVDVYDLPITAASVPSFAITKGVNKPHAAAVDAAGNLYVGNAGRGDGEYWTTLAVYAPPFSAASSPSITLTVWVEGYTFSIYSIVVAN